MMLIEKLVASDEVHDMVNKIKPWNELMRRVSGVTGWANVKSAYMWDGNELDEHVVMITLQFAEEEWPDVYCEATFIESIDHFTMGTWVNHEYADDYADLVSQAHTLMRIVLSSED